MNYDNSNNLFVYYTNTKDIPYKYLETVSRQFVIVNDCKKTKELSDLIKKSFLDFNFYKPKSSKSESKEIYIVAKFLKLKKNLEP